MDDEIQQRNLETYQSLYGDDRAHLAYEIRAKMNIVSSFRRVLRYARGRKVLDIGFGTGNILELLLRNGADAYGVDMVAEAVERAKVTLPRAHVLQAEATQLPFADDFFDVVVCSHVIEHVRDDQKVIEEIQRVLKPGGMFLLGVPSLGAGYSPLHYREYTRSQVLRLFDASWDLVEMRSVGSRFLQRIVRFLTLLSAGFCVRRGAFELAQPRDISFSSVRTLYHRIVVPILLALLKIDQLLFSHFTHSPIEIWVALRKRQ